MTLTPKTQLRRDIQEFLDQILPVWNSVKKQQEAREEKEGEESESNNHRDTSAFFGNLLSSCLQQKGEENEDETSFEKQLLELLHVSLSFVSECREDGNIMISTKRHDSAVKHYRLALKTVEWSAGLIFGSNHLVAKVRKLLSKKSSANSSSDAKIVVDDEEDVIDFVELCRLFEHAKTKSEKKEEQEQEGENNNNNNNNNNNRPTVSEQLLIEEILCIWRQLESIAVACLANGALCLNTLGKKKFLQSQRWCERGLKHVENLLSAHVLNLATSITNGGGNKKTINNMLPGQIFTLGLKLRYRLGQSLEGQNDLEAAISTYSLCLQEASSSSSTFSLTEQESKFVQESIKSCEAKTATCHAELKAQKEERKAKMANMF